ncbi:MAG: hypothetical protein HUU01_00180 [Saprospiraceae bacterium]|nr:hypothetical protein [Saprospiraceae bacterium]
MRSMPFYTAVVALFFFLAAAPCRAQLTPSSIFTLIEESTSGKYMDTLPSTGPAIVDINSMVHIKIDLAALEDEMFRFQGISGSDSRLQKLKEFNTLLRNQNKIIGLINEKFSGNGTPTMQDYKELATQSDEFLEELENTLDDELYEELSNSPIVANQLATSGLPYIIIVINFLQEKAQDLRNNLMEQLQVDGQTDSSLLIFFRLGAFIKNKSGGRPVHVENFDDIAPDAYSEISSFSAPLSAAEKNALSETSMLNDSLQVNTSNATFSFRQLIKSRVGNLFPSDTSRVKFKKVFNTTLAELNQSSATKPAARILIENDLSLSKVDQFYTLATETYQNLAGNFPQALLSSENIDKTFDDFSALIVRSFSSFKDAVTTYEQKGVALADGGTAPGAADLDNLVGAYDNYVTSVNQDIAEIKGLFSTIRSILDPFKKAYLANEDFSDQVRRLTAGSIPASGLIELKYIGERKAGDEILIKAVLERGKKEGNRNFEQKVLLRRYVTMSRIAVHVKMSGSVILANPYNRASTPAITLQNKFQFSPTYGIILKWGSRKSKFYNDFIAFGAGLGFSSPDFNLDGTPEFGSGIMITAFRDLLSAGWGWNFGLDTPYSFIGFNIPFSIGGIQSASPEGFLED